MQCSTALCYTICHRKVCLEQGHVANACAICQQALRLESESYGMLQDSHLMCLAGLGSSLRQLLLCGLHHAADGAVSDLIGSLPLLEVRSAACPLSAPLLGFDDGFAASGFTSGCHGASLTVQLCCRTWPSALRMNSSTLSIRPTHSICSGMYRCLAQT